MGADGVPRPCPRYKELGRGDAGRCPQPGLSKERSTRAAPPAPPGPATPPASHPTSRASSRPGARPRLTSLQRALGTARPSGAPPPGATPLPLAPPPDPGPARRAALPPHRPEGAPRREAGSSTTARRDAGPTPSGARRRGAGEVPGGRVEVFTGLPPPPPQVSA